MGLRRAMVVAGFVLLGNTGTTLVAQTPDWVSLGYHKEITPARQAARVQRMLEADRATPPEREAVLFMGSATTSGWNLPHYFPEYRTIKRGLGGSLVSEATHYADQLIIPFAPSTIVLYAGDNDIAYGMTAEMVARDTERFIQSIREALPDTRIVLVRPSIARLEVVEAVKAVSPQLAAMAAADDQVYFVELLDGLLGDDGGPRVDLLDEDMHHLNDAGFDLLTAATKPVLAQAEADYWAGREPAR